MLMLIIVATLSCIAGLYFAICCITRDEIHVLKERLARGEIIEAQYKEQRRLLEE